MAESDASPTSTQKSSAEAHENAIGVEAAAGVNTVIGRRISSSEEDSQKPSSSNKEQPSAFERFPMDGNTPDRMEAMGFKPRNQQEARRILRRLRPILEVHDQLVQVTNAAKLKHHKAGSAENFRFRDFDVRVVVREGRTNHEACLLSFNDVETEGIDPREWEEQTVTIKWASTRNVETVGLRRVKQVGFDDWWEPSEGDDGNGKNNVDTEYSGGSGVRASRRRRRKRIKTDRYSPPTP